MHIILARIRLCWLIHMMNWFRKLFPAKLRQTQNPLGQVEIVGQIITFHHPDGELQQVAIEDLTEVGVLTTDEGPFAEDVYFVLLGAKANQGCAIPQGVTGAEDLLMLLQTIPGFKNEALIEAMGCTANNKFLLWKK